MITAIKVIKARKGRARGAVPQLKRHAMPTKGAPKATRAAATTGITLNTNTTATTAATAATTGTGQAARQAPLTLQTESVTLNLERNPASTTTGTPSSCACKTRKAGTCGHHLALHTDKLQEALDQEQDHPSDEFTDASLYLSQKAEKEEIEDAPPKKKGSRSSHTQSQIATRKQQ